MTRYFLHDASLSTSQAQAMCQVSRTDVKNQRFLDHFGGKNRKLPSANDGDRLETRDPSICENCSRCARQAGLRYCPRCANYMRYKIQDWARESNPIPGIDIREC